MKRSVALRAMGVLLSVAAVFSLQACGPSKARETQPVRLDLAGVSMPFPRPSIEPMSRLAGVPELPDSVNQALNMRRAFFSWDFARLDTSLLKMHEDFLAGRIDNTVPRLFFSGMEDTELAGVEACGGWLRAMPNSFPAHWVCGAIWHKGAWAARGDGYSSEVGEARFALMRERLHRSNELLEKALALHPKPLGALTLLAENHTLLGDPDQLETYLARAEAIMPTYIGIHSTRLNYALPEWGGSKEQVQAAFERAKALGVKGNDLTYLEDNYVVRPGKMSDPRAPRAYWEKAIREHPTKARLSKLLDNFIWVENWAEAMPVADRLVKEYPDDASALARRATILVNLGRIPEAQLDYRRAAAMGHDGALQELIMANIKGGLGLKPKDFNAAMELCRYGANLGSRVGANCIGAAYHEAKSMGISFPVDHAQSLAWHLVAARGGHYNSQHDLGWFLFTGRGGQLQAEEAKRIGTFWLRRAAEQGHHFAKRKLEENGISLSEELPADHDYKELIARAIAMFMAWVL